MKQLCLAMACLALGACSTQSPTIVHASWYLLPPSRDNGATAGSESVEKPDDPQLYIALLNSGQHELGVEKVIINRRDDGHGAEWQWPSPNKAEPLRLEPGRLVTLAKRDFKVNGSASPECLLPVEVLIQFDADTTKWHANKLHWFEAKPDPWLLKAMLSGILPSAIPVSWENKCAPSATWGQPLVDQAAK